MHVDVGGWGEKGERGEEGEVCGGRVLRVHCEEVRWKKKKGR